MLIKSKTSGSAFLDERGNPTDGRANGAALELARRVRSREVNRRKFLGGAAVALGLPFLDSVMAPRRAAAACPPAPRRFIGYYFPNGVWNPDFYPTTAAPGWVPPFSLEPIGPMRHKTLFITGLDNQPVARPPQSPPNAHGGGTGAFLTQVRVNSNYNDPNRTSIDQVIAEHYKGCTKIPSLQLGFETGGGCDGAPCQFSQHISWYKNTVLPKSQNFQQIFDRLFAGFEPKAADGNAQMRQALRKSVLDYALDESKSLGAKLNAADRRKLEQYTTAVRELEERIRQGTGGAASAACMSKPAMPAFGGDVNKQMETMFDLMVLAFQCDLTRVITFMSGTSASNRSYGFIGANAGDHHDASHNTEQTAGRETFKKIVRWEVEQYVKLCQKLDKVVEADGKTLLDNSVVFWSSELADGNRHSHFEKPIFLGGTLGGFFKTGQLISKHRLPIPEHQGANYGPIPGLVQIADLFVSILQGMGVPATKFGNSSGPFMDAHARG